MQSTRKREREKKEKTNDIRAVDDVNAHVAITQDDLADKTSFTRRANLFSSPTSYCIFIIFSVNKKRKGSTRRGRETPERS